MDFLKPFNLKSFIWLPIEIAGLNYIVELCSTAPFAPFGLFSSADCFPSSKSSGFTCDNRADAKMAR